MKKLITYQIAAVSLILIISFMSLFISEAQNASPGFINRREIPNLSGQSSTYRNAAEYSNSPLVIPESSNIGGDNSTTDDKRMRILGERFNTDAQKLCEEVSVGMLDFSKESAVTTGAAWMEKIFDVKLIADYRRVFPMPNPGEKVVALQCRALIQYSVKVEATTDFYLLVDSDGNSRVRWVPDNSTSRTI